MNEALQRMLELKREAEQLVKTVNEDTKRHAEALQKTRTEQLQYTIEKLSQFAPLIKEYGLDKKNGFYRIQTEIPSEVRPDNKLEIILLYNGSVFSLTSYKRNSCGIWRWGYHNDFRINKDTIFPTTEHGAMGDYAREVEAFMNGIDYHLPEIEKLIMEDCQMILQNMMEEANRNNERVKAEF